MQNVSSWIQIGAFSIAGAYMDQTGIAEAGMILRRDDGSIIFSDCRALRFYSSALESELAACLEGVTRALETSSEDMIIETDCLELVRLASKRSHLYRHCDLYKLWSQLETQQKNFTPILA
jgi:hypothetical protein